MNGAAITAKATVSWNIRLTALGDDTSYSSTHLTRDVSLEAADANEQEGHREEERRLERHEEVSQRHEHRRRADRQPSG